VSEIIKKKKNNERRITNTETEAHPQQNKIWACGFSWFTGPVGLCGLKSFS
jgi:hypothetical protein